LLLLLLLGNSGCPQVVLPGEKIDLGGLDDCPASRLEELVIQANTFYINTPTRQIACALERLRLNAGATGAAPVAARLCFLVADRERNAARREKLASEGIRWAELALLQGTDNAAVHYYLALNLGLAVRSHAALAMKNLKRLESTLKKACQQDCSIDYAGPMRLLGMLYLLAPPWPKGIGDIDKALELLERAVHDYPQHPLNHVFYARALWEAEEDDAREQITEHLQRARGLLTEAKWRGARQRWLEELRRVEREAGIKAAPPSASPAEARPGSNS